MGNICQHCKRPRATTTLALYACLIQRVFTSQNIKFCIKHFFSKWDQIRSFLRIWSYLLKKSLMEIFVQCFPLTWLLLDQIYLIQCNTYLSKQRASKTAITNLIYLYFQTFYKQLCISILKFKYSELCLFVKPITHQNPAVSKPLLRKF